MPYGKPGRGPNRGPGPSLAGRTLILGKFLPRSHRFHIKGGYPPNVNKLRERKGIRLTQRDGSVEAMFDRLEDLKNHPDENLVPYEEFELGLTQEPSQRRGF